MEQIEPRPVLGTRARPDSNKGTSVWDVMHPTDLPAGNPPPITHHHRKASGGVTDEMRNQRRDPIGYYEDTKFGGSLGANMPNLNPGPNFNQNLKANTQENYGSYQPSWSNHGSTVNLQQYNDQPNDLLEAAMVYQNPITVGNGYKN